MDIALFVLLLEIKVTQKCNQKGFSIKIPKVKLNMTHKTPLAFLPYCGACWRILQLMWVLTSLPRHLWCRSLPLMHCRLRGWELMEWLMRSWSWSVKSCQLTVTKSATNGWTMTTRPYEYRWLLGMVELNNGPIKYHLTLEAFAAIHILESFPQLKCEIPSLIHAGRCSTSVYQLRQLVKSTFLIGGYSRDETLFRAAEIYIVCSVTTGARCESVMRTVVAASS